MQDISSTNIADFRHLPIVVRQITHNIGRMYEQCWKIFLNVAGSYIFPTVLRRLTDQLGSNFIIIHLIFPCSIDTDDEFAAVPGSVAPGSQMRTSSLDLFDSLMGKRWRKRPDVRSLSEAVYSCLNSASRMVSRNLTDNGFFRRRALSASLNASLAESSSLHESSDEAGHYSDALDYPTTDSHLPTFAEFLYRKSVSETEQTNKSNFAESKLVTGSPELLRMFPTVPYTTYDNDDGYIEDNESDADHMPFRLAPRMMESDPELSHEVLNEASERTSSSRTHRIRSSSLVRIPQNRWFDLPSDHLAHTDHGLLVTVDRATKKPFGALPTVSVSNVQNACIRKRRLHRRSSLNRVCSLLR